MADNPVKWVVAVLAGTILVLAVLNILGMLASLPAAPSPGDPMYEAMVQLIHTGGRTLGLAGLVTFIAIGAWAAGQANSW